MKRALLNALLILSSPLALGGNEKTVGAELEFVSEVAAIQSGVPFTVALRVRPDEGFHTYWKAPGIVGVPTSIKWTLPDGFQAGPIQWPAPEVVEMAGHPAHGYHREVLLLVEITPPATLDADAVTLTGDLSWMACARECHPGFATRRLTLPVNRSPQAQLDSTWAPRIAKERTGLPAPSAAWKIVVQSKPGESPIRLVISPVGKDAGDPGEIYFFSEDGQISSEPPQTAARRKDGSYLITAERSEWGPKAPQATLPGVLVASGSWSASKVLRSIQVAPSYGQ